MPTQTKPRPSKLQAEIDRNNAEAAFFKANARVANALARQEEMACRVLGRSEEEILARDEYNYVYVFDHDVDDDSVKLCMQTLTTWSRQKPKCHITIQLSTGGGSIFAGFALIDFIRDLRKKEHKITIKVFGQAASMGAVILQAADERVIGESAFLLLHKGSMYTGGDAAQIEDEVKLFKMLQERMLSILSGGDPDRRSKIDRGWKRTDWWLDSSAALGMGLVDSIE